MVEKLFRDQALEARYGESSGDGSNVPPPSHWLIAAAAIFIVAAIGATLFFGSYTASDTVRGYITPSEGSVRIFVRRTGNVAQLFVREGDQVSTGDPLLSVSAERLANGLSVDAAVISGLEAELGVVADRLARLEILQRQEADAAEQRLQAELNEQTLLQRQLASSSDALSLRQKNLARAETLHSRGFLSESDLRRQRLDLLAKRQAHADLDRVSERLQALIGIRRTELESLPMQHANRHGELQSGFLRLRRELANARAAAAYTLTAPVGGVVSGLTVTRGHTVTSAAPLMTLLPVPARFCAVLLVPSRTAGFVAAGDAVQLRIDAYPYQKFGVIHGTVAMVSRTVVLPGEAVAPVPMTEPSYQVRVNLDTQALATGAGEMPLRTGMTLNADVFRDRRRLFEWLLEPVIGAVRRM